MPTPSRGATRGGTYCRNVSPEACRRSARRHRGNTPATLAVLAFEIHDLFVFLDEATG
jgi:hypothetical protein